MTPPFLHDVSLQVQTGTVHCLVCDSGSGKTMTSLATIGLLPHGSTATGSIRLEGVDTNLIELESRRWPAVRGRRIGYVGQNALGCLHPAYTVEYQLVEAIRRHQQLSSDEAWALAIEELAAVDLPNPEGVAAARPAQLSGGVCQRVALAMALCNRPDVFIADEPTTALDDETQDNILELIESRAADDGLAVLLITHDREVVDKVATHVTSIRNGTSGSDSAPAVAQVRERVRRPGSDADAVPALAVADVSMTYASAATSAAAVESSLTSPLPQAASNTTVAVSTVIIFFIAASLSIDGAVAPLVVDASIVEECRSRRIRRRKFSHLLRAE